MEEPVNVIRESSRAALTFSRRAHRDEETDGRRHIVNENITPAVAADIAHRLKSKNGVSTEELRTLKNSILDDPKHIEMVLKTHCGVRGLVRELTSHEARRQSEAAGCLCNLALGDERACTALAKAGGPYLLTALRGLQTDLASGPMVTINPLGGRLEPLLRCQPSSPTDCTIKAPNWRALSFSGITCAWTLGNAAGSGTKASSLLAEQGAVSALAAMMTSSHDDVSDAAAAALAQFAYQMGDDFSKEHVTQILKTLSQGRLKQPSLHLLSIISCHDDFNQILDEDLFQKLLQYSIQSIGNITENYHPFLYSIRTLANITINDQVYNALVGCFSVRVDAFKEVLTMNDEVVKTLLWFLGNLFNYNCDNEVFNVLLS